MSNRRNIVLTGFMGTGKTAVGRAVGRILGREFVDMDELIAARAGKPIPRIFAEDGERAKRLVKQILRNKRKIATLLEELSLRTSRIQPMKEKKTKRTIYSGNFMLPLP